ncbi:hypothetical protein [Radiobacillus sp. PE A8.2]
MNKQDDDPQHLLVSSLAFTTTSRTERYLLEVILATLYMCAS